MTAPRQGLVRLVASKADTVRDLALRILSALSEHGEVEVAATVEQACLLADAVNEAARLSEGRLAQEGGTIVRERRRGRSRVLLVVRLRLALP